jgi:DNA-binding NarL/FixJ family response regulator
MVQEPMSTEGDMDPNKPIRVLIADDHPIVRDGISNELARHPDIEVVGQASDGDETMELAGEVSPDVILLDINMPGRRATEIIHEVSVSPNPPRVLVISAFGDVEYVLAMLKAGAQGYLLKDEEPSVIADGIRTVYQGETCLSPTVTTSFVSATLHDKTRVAYSQLTNREREVLNLVANGNDNEAISEELSITLGTVKNHISSIYEKLGLGSRAEVVAWAWQKGIVKKKSDIPFPSE